LTPEDVLDMSDDNLYELVDGRLVTLNMCVKSSLMDHCHSHRPAYVFLAHGYTCFPGKRNRMRRPDVSLILAERMTPELFKEGFTPIRPDLAVEVVSPNDRVYDLEEKLEDHHTVDVPLVWLIYPSTRKVRVILPGIR
jgi:Uma2 family endonuclease